MGGPLICKVQSCNLAIPFLVLRGSLCQIYQIRLPRLARVRRGSGQAGSDQLSALFGTVSVSLPGYLGVIAVVFLVAVLTALTSGLAVKAHLKRVD